MLCLHDATAAFPARLAGRDEPTETAEATGGEVPIAEVDQDPRGSLRLRTPLECFPDRAAIVFEDGGVTYRQLGENVRRHAAALASLGVGRGDRVGLFVGNRPELIELYLACFRVGAIALPLNTRFQIPEVVQACEQSTPRIMIADPERLPRVADLRASLAPAWSFA